MEGLVVDSLDVDELSRTLKLLADDRQLRLKLGAQAAERAREFEWSKVSARLYEHFRNVASRAD
jgi:glycosyltransferase involved in cell wall biosynthesis